jgi:predicted dehydrogenase
MTNLPTTPLKVAIIGCGRPLGTAGVTGFGMAHRHMAGFFASGRCTLVAVADLSRDNAEAFVAAHNPAAAIYADYRRMLRDVRPDVVSVCLWPHLHAQVVCAAARFKPRVILCEKPMDIHWNACLRMHRMCRRHGVLLAINHQRRFNRPIAKAKALLDGGAIGRLLRLDGAWQNLADAGTHVLDLMFFFNHDTPAEWVLGQIEMRGATRVFGAVNAGHGLTEFRFQNGVRAVYHFGHQHAELGCLLRLTGEGGIIEILFEAPWLRLRRYGQPDWEVIDTGESIHDDQAIYRGIADVLACLEAGTMPQLASERALRATEIIFATHESSRRRGRVDLPLPSGPCAMLSMLASGELHADFPPAVPPAGAKRRRRKPTRKAAARRSRGRPAPRRRPK